ncbi:4-hydroxythreonine-4-phosphate dehydrogenase PdxA [Curtobacterium sp. MCBD17_040]|uniref:4-hydroxythreonine-4-phosphate dehydrogenase PdxA n=1 Tax=Curtobacterium sp. MCBD17_040 TaxID=2175674 RepID=UPI000DA928C7|nr:4-hydroxythreonine-4-phosphate dehydrogenase PdxA [Curtobacterium sp. MCBD17_040]WIB63094.1 4-hydroxythreonine-4-phosphate dehydrogenase PdxA [Curtobacterium sp. MCBD17_040]
MAQQRPRVALTLGDPAGIGPELAAKVLSRPGTLDANEVHVLADRDEFERAFADARLPAVPLGDEPRPGVATLLDDHSAPPTPIPTGVVSEEAGHRAMHQLRRAVALAAEGRVGAIVFAPLNKTSLHLAGMQEEDELRWFAKQMDHHGTTSELNVLEDLWTARVTSHIPLSAVAARVTPESVRATIGLLHQVLTDAGIEPRLGVCALNPHAGENGNFGREEIDAIAPAVAAATADGIDVRGPFPSDTIFLAARRGDFNGIVTMYHDQGQIAMKLLGFSGGVTIQGGLPVSIATPAHGTAFEIVGQGVADPTSMANAFDIAAAVAARRQA